MEQNAGLEELSWPLSNPPAFRKAIATSSVRAFTERVLGQFNLAPRFKFILTAEDVSEGKPHPEIYLKAAARLNVEPRQMMVLEDSYNGCQAAITAGAFTVAVPGGQSRSQDFSSASLVADTLADPRIYAELGAAIALTACRDRQRADLLALGLRCGLVCQLLLALSSLALATPAALAAAPKGSCAGSVATTLGVRAK